MQLTRWVNPVASKANRLALVAKNKAIQGDYRQNQCITAILDKAMADMERVSGPIPIQGHSESDLFYHDCPSNSTERSIGQTSYRPLRNTTAEKPRRPSRFSQSQRVTLRCLSMCNS